MLFTMWKPERSIQSRCIFRSWFESLTSICHACMFRYARIITPCRSYVRCQNLSLHLQKDSWSLKVEKICNIYREMARFLSANSLPWCPCGMVANPKSINQLQTACMLGNPLYWFDMKLWNIDVKRDKAMVGESANRIRLLLMNRRAKNTNKTTDVFTAGLDHDG